MRGLRLAIIVAAVGVGAVGALALTQPSSPLASLLRPECTIGLAGTALTLTFEGSDAQAGCDSLEGTVGPDGGTWYRYGTDESPIGVLVCRQPYQGSVVTVRDQGALMLYGSSVCTSLQEQAADAAYLAESEALWLAQQQDRYSDPAVIRCDDMMACAQDVNPFPLAAEGGLDWCLRWTNDSGFRYSQAFLNLGSGEQEAVRAYCERGQQPGTLPPAP